MKNFVQPGQVITVKTATPVVSGRVYDVNGIIGVATGSLSAAEIAGGKDEYEMALGGVFALPKGAATYAFGDDASYDSAAGEMLASGGVIAGKMIAEDGDDIHVLINGRGEASGY